MYSLVNFERYKKPPLWGGYVIECTNERAIYVGISKDLDNRMREHLYGAKQASRFVTLYGGPLRVLELYFCQTEEEARIWEANTSNQLYDRYHDRPVYHLGYRSIKPRPRQCSKEDVQAPDGITLISKKSIDAWSRIFKRNEKHRRKQMN